jgi:hypothetical protein
VTKPRLIVEGSDDRHVIKNLLKARDVEISDPVDAQGIDRLLEKVDSYLKGSDVLAIIADADLDVAATWQAVRDRLLRNGYTNVSATPDPEGLIVTAPGKPGAGVWIMPDNTVRGALEDFVNRLIPAGDALWPRAKRVVADIPAEERLFTSPAKAEIHTWLAWQRDPGTPMGLAITKRYVTADSRSADLFVQWIRRLQALSRG